MKPDNENAPQPDKHTGRKEDIQNATGPGPLRQGYLIPVPLMNMRSQDFNFRSGAYRLEGDADTVIGEMIRCGVWDSFAPQGIRRGIESYASGTTDGRFYVFLWKADQHKGSLYSISGPDTEQGRRVIQDFFTRHIRTVAASGAPIVCG